MKGKLDNRNTTTPIIAFKHNARKMEKMNPIKHFRAKLTTHKENIIIMRDNNCTVARRNEKRQ